MEDEDPSSYKEQTQWQAKSFEFKLEGDQKNDI
jgi:hypothetical protein